MHRSGIAGSRGNFIFNFLKNHLPFSTAAATFYIPTSKHTGFWFFHVLISTYNFRCLVAQSCLTLCDPMDCSPPGSSAHGILQARILELIAISFSKGSSISRDRTQVSYIAAGILATEPPGKPHLRIALFLYPFSSWGNWASGRLSNLITTPSWAEN